MIFPKLSRNNYRYRGPVESHKIIKNYSDIENSLKELKISIDKSYELFDIYNKDISNYKYSDMNRISNINKVINDMLGV